MLQSSAAEIVSFPQKRTRSEETVAKVASSSSSRWKEDEVKVLIDNICCNKTQSDDKFDWGQISNTLNRTKLQCMNKYKDLVRRQSHHQLPFEIPFLDINTSSNNTLHVDTEQSSKKTTEETTEETTMNIISDIPEGILSFSRDESNKIRQLVLQPPPVDNPAFTDVENKIVHLLAHTQYRRKVAKCGTSISWNTFASEFSFQCKAYCYTGKANTENVFVRTKDQLRERHKSLQKKLKKCSVLDNTK